MALLCISSWLAVIPEAQKCQFLFFQTVTNMVLICFSWPSETRGSQSSKSSSCNCFVSMEYCLRHTDILGRICVLSEINTFVTMQ